MKKNYQQLFKIIGKEKLLLNESLSRHTSFKIGGPADLFLSVTNRDDLITAVKAARQTGTNFFILGGGTNLLVGDQGIRGLVIKNQTSGIKILGWKGNVKSQVSRVNQTNLEVESGVTTNRLVRFCLNEGLDGLEAFLGLPGTVGGAIFGNSHYGDQLFNDKIASLTTLNRKNQLEELTSREFEKKKKGLVIISVVLNLKKANKKDLWDKAEKFVTKRKKTQPLEYPSAGCIFQNISQAQAMRLATPGLTRSTGFLIEACGLKGKRIGDAQISEKHTNFIINLGGATAHDVLSLIELCQKKVKEKFNLDLKLEIIKVGEF